MTWDKSSSDNRRVGQNSVNCGHPSVVSVLNNGRAHDQTLAKYTRNVFMCASACNIELKVVHVAGKHNPVADLLSRWYITPSNF